MVSDVTVANALNSASVEDLDTARCFLADQEIEFEPRNVMKAVVEILVLVFEAQSASLSVLISSLLDF